MKEKDHQNIKKEIIVAFVIMGCGLAAELIIGFISQIFKKL